MLYHGRQILSQRIREARNIYETAIVLERMCGYFVPAICSKKARTTNAPNCQRDGCAKKQKCSRWFPQKEQAVARRRSLVVVFPVLFMALQGFVSLQCFAQSRELALTMADTVTPNFNELVFCSATSLCTPPTFPVGTSSALAIGGSYA